MGSSKRLRSGVKKARRELAGDGVRRKKGVPTPAPHERKRIGKSTCFLCGCRLSPATRSEEHVIPKWVQDRYKLHNQALLLLNGTSIKYSHLKIPCCRKCNNEYLSAVERSIRDGVDAGAPALRAVDCYTLYLWLAKIFYGILRKELSLNNDQARPHLGKIVSRRLIRELAFLEFTLHGACVPMKVSSMQPEIKFPLASIFIVRLQASPDQRLQFDFRDSLVTRCIALALGEVGIIATFSDGGATQVEFAGIFERVGDHPLHPIQFSELVAAVFYKASLFNRTPKYMSLQEAGVWRVSQAPLQGLSTKPLFDQWDDNAYASVLSVHTRSPLEMIRPNAGELMSWVYDGTGGLPFIDLTTTPWGMGQKVHPRPVRPPPTRSRNKA